MDRMTLEAYEQTTRNMTAFALGLKAKEMEGLRDLMTGLAFGGPMVKTTCAMQIAMMPVLVTMEMAKKPNTQET